MGKTNETYLKCYCNDDFTCPIVSRRAKSAVTSATQAKRHCFTNTVCFTKRYRRANGSTWLKYFCDQSSANSIRGKLIEFRDCKINSTNKVEVEHVVETSAEYCCDSHDFCNLDMQPVRSVLDIEEYSNSFYNENTKKIKESTINSNSFRNELFTPLNVALLSGLLITLIVIMSIVLFNLYKRRRRFKGLLKRKQQQQNQHSTSISTNSSSCSSPSPSPLVAENIKKRIGGDDELLLFLNINKCDRKKQQIQEEDEEEEEKHQSEDKKAEHEALLKSLQLTTAPISSVPTIDTHLSPYSSLNDYLVGINNNSISSSNTSNNVSCGVGVGVGLAENNSWICSSNNTTTAGTAATAAEWSGSGSGAGIPQLLQRTIARQIKLIYPCIGKGRFGEVYKGTWRDEFVAVKTFNSADEKSWENECSIYNTTGFRHENILGFIAADNIDTGTYTELWLITEYHHNGSLHDFLNSNIIDEYQALKMAISIVNGLDHLHTPIESCTGKPALAHCDIKSKNILVKSDLTCCIGDLGLALRGDKNGQVVIHDAAACIRTGTKRYLAPEILTKTIDTRSLVQFQIAEIYSLALVFWEILRRTKFEIRDSNLLVSLSSNSSFIPITSSSLNKFLIYEYKLPYFEYLPNDPDDAQMRQLVCEAKARPEINKLWQHLPVLSELTCLVEESWTENPHGRLNALRLKKSLNSIKRKHFSSV